MLLKSIKIKAAAMAAVAMMAICPVAAIGAEIDPGETPETSAVTSIETESETKPETKPETDSEAQQAAQPAESGVMVLEGTFEGRGVFLFTNNMIAYSHKDGEYPTGVKVNGKPWGDLTQPLMLDSAAVPARIIRKQARGTVTLLPADDFARLELNDHQDGSASYRIEFGTK